MTSNNFGFYGQGPAQSPKPVNAPMSARAVWAGTAHDFGGYSAQKQAKGDFHVIGLNDLALVEEDLHALYKAKDVKALTPPQENVSGTARKLRVEDRLRQNLPPLLGRAYPQVRFSEPLHAVRALAVKKGMFSEGGAVFVGDAFWQDSTEEGLVNVREFLVELKAYLQGEKFQEEWRLREERAGCLMAEQENFLRSIFTINHEFNAVVLNMGFGQLSAVPGHAREACIGSMIQQLNCGTNLIGAMRADPGIGGDVLGCLVHLEFHQVCGPYLRTMFLLRPGELGLREQFLARIYRLWQYTYGPSAWIADCRGYPNKIVGGLGRVSFRDSASVERLRKAIEFCVRKDLLMRVGSERAETFQFGVLWQRVSPMTGAEFNQRFDRR